MRIHGVSPSEEEKQPTSEFAMEVRIEILLLFLFYFSLHILERMLEVAGIPFSFLVAVVLR